MEYVYIKFIVAIAFFTTLIVGALWAGERLQEIRKYWEDDEDGR